MKKMMISIAAVLVSLLAAGCATTTDYAQTGVSKSQRAEALRRESEKFEDVRWQQVETAARQTYDDLRTQPANPNPR